MSDKSFQEMIDEAVERAIDRYFERIQTASEDRLFSIPMLVSYSGFSSKMIRRFINRDHDPLPAFMVSKEYRVSKKAFDEWMDRYQVKKRVTRIVH